MPQGGYTPLTKLLLLLGLFKVLEWRPLREGTLLRVKVDERLPMASLLDVSDSEELP